MTNLTPCAAPEYARPWSWRLGILLAALLIALSVILPGSNPPATPNACLSAATDLVLVRNPILGAIASPASTFTATFDARSNGKATGFERDGKSMEDADHRTTPPGRTVTSKINAYGFRGPDPARDASAVQIAIVGDEFLFGLGLHDRQLATTFLAQRIDQANHGATCRVLNLGVICANIETKLHCAEWMVDQFPIRAVVIVLGPNDRWSYFDRVRQTARSGDAKSLGHSWTTAFESPLPGRATITLERVRDLCRRLANSARQRSVPVAVCHPWPESARQFGGQDIAQIAAGEGIAVLHRETANTASAASMDPSIWESAHKALSDEIAPWVLKAISSASAARPYEIP